MDLLNDLSGWMPSLFKAAGTTLVLTIASVSCGLVLSLFLALGKISRNKPLSWLCSGYIFLFRGTPLLMQLFFVWYALPQISPALTITSQFAAAWLAYSLNTAAYLAEIIRAAIQSIDKGQLEATRALGLSYAKAMRLVIIPQSIRRLIPPVGNEFIMVIKDTSLVSIIAMVDLMKKTLQIQSSTGSPLIYVPAALIYLGITALFTWLFNRLEKKFSVYE